MPELIDIFADRIVERHLALSHHQRQQGCVEYLADRGEIEHRAGRDRPPAGTIGETEIEEQGAAVDADCDRRAGPPQQVRNFLGDDLLDLVVGRPGRGVRGDRAEEAEQQGHNEAHGALSKLPDAHYDTR